MPEENAIEKARKAKEEGKSPSTQAGESVRQEIHHVREGKHGARSPQQTIAIGLSKARRAGVSLPAPKMSVSAKTRAQAKRDAEKGKKSPRRRASRTRSRATSGALRKEGRSAGSRRKLSSHARSAARERSRRSRHRSAMKAARTKHAQARFRRPPALPRAAHRRRRK